MEKAQNVGTYGEVSVTVTLYCTTKDDWNWVVWQCVAFPTHLYHIEVATTYKAMTSRAWPKLFRLQERRAFPVIGQV